MGAPLHAILPAALLLTHHAGGIMGVVATATKWRDRKHCHLSKPATSRAPDFGHALNEVLNTLRKAGIKPPKTLLIASTFVVSARVELPIDPRKPRPVAQMWDLVQAEMEAPFSEYCMTLALDDVAHLQTLESRLACGWIGRASDTDEPPVWLAAATALSNWKEWEAAARAHRMKLAGAMPFALALGDTEPIEPTQHLLHHTMWRLWRGDDVFLPRILFGAVPVPAWKQPPFWRIAAPLLTLSLIVGVHLQQRSAIQSIQARFDMDDLQTKKNALVKQQEARLLAEAAEARTRLQADRQRLAQLMPETERLAEVERMAARFPALLQTIAQNIHDDAVLEGLRSARAGQNAIGQIQIIGWSPSYTGAQSFALDMQRALGSIGYAVAGTEVRASNGRADNPGYRATFWLLPSEEELEEVHP